MDNNRITDPSNDNSWLDEFLSKPHVDGEIKADEKAVASHDMPNLSDMELERILAENWDIDSDMEEVPAEPDFDEEAPIVEEPQYEEEEKEENGVPRKVRPKRKNGYGIFGIPHLLSTVIWFLIVLAIGISLGRLIWVCASDILAFGRHDQTVTITITETDTVETITNKLF